MTLPIRGFIKTKSVVFPILNFQGIFCRTEDTCPDKAKLIFDLSEGIPDPSPFQAKSQVKPGQEMAAVTKSSKNYLRIKGRQRVCAHTG